MKPWRALLVAFGLAGTAACTALLGDYTVGSGTSVDAGTPDASGGDASPDGGTGDDGGAGRDGGGDGGGDAGGGVDAGPAVDGGFLALYNFAATNTSPPANMRVAFDPAGNLFILFAYSLPTSVLGAALTPVGSFDMALVKVGTNGRALWVKSFGSGAQEYPGGLAVDGNGDVFISGATEGAALDFGGTAGLVNRASTRYLGWIAKIDGATGAPVKAFSVDSASNQGALCQSLAARGNRVVAMCNVYGAASFIGPGGTAISVSPPDPTGVGFAIAQLDAATLEAGWASAFGSAGNDFGASVTLAPNNDVLFVANTSASAATTLNDSRGTLSLPLSGPTSAVVARLAANSGSAIWGKAFSAPDGSNQAYFNGVAIGAGRAVVVGSTRGRMSFGLNATASTGSDDMLFVTFDGALGTATGAKTYGGAAYEEASAVALDRFDFLAVAGRYGSTGLAFDGLPVPDPLGTSSSGVVLRLGPGGNAAWAAGFTTALSGTLLQSWSVATDPTSARVAAAGTYKGVINFGDNNPAMSAMDGGAYNVWVTVRAP